MQAAWDGYLLLWWRWFGMLVVALQVRTAWLMQAGLEAWSVSGLCTPEQDRMRIGCSSQGYDVGCCTECLAPISKGHGHQVCHFVQKELVWARLVSSGCEHTCVSAHMAKSSFFSSWGEQFSTDVEDVSHEAVVSCSQPLQGEGSKLRSCCAFPSCALST